MSESVYYCPPRYLLGCCDDRLTICQDHPPLDSLGCIEPPYLAYYCMSMDLPVAQFIRAELTSATLAQN